MNTPDDSEGIDAEIEIDKEPNGFSYRTALLSEPKIEDSPPPREKETVAELAEPDRVVRRKWKKYAIFIKFRAKLTLRLSIQRTVSAEEAND